MLAIDKYMYVHTAVLTHLRKMLTTLDFLKSHWIQHFGIMTNTKSDKSNN